MQDGHLRVIPSNSILRNIEFATSHVTALSNQMRASSAAAPTASQPHLTALRLHFADHRIFGSFT